ncbi:putative uncharacterized protein [Bacteroides sp. CAG:1076]|mgnify:CR=1 FL=1|nr:putative uncharacterized protein [Bacteroides sp. CAG:1076]
MSNMKYYIGHTLDSDIRFKASSGGIGSYIIKYLLSSKEYGTSMTMVFNSKECKYEPKLIHSYEEYHNCGSVYQDIDVYEFIKNNINNIINGIIVTCMPCQVRKITKILTSYNIKHFIISLCCSGQTKVEGTWCLYKFLGLKRQEIKNIQYRGNGWPSGIQIELTNGKIIKRDNYSYPWNIIHSSFLFRPSRCLFCTYKTVPYSDINLADPWLIEYQTDTIGNSVIIANTSKGYKLIEELISNNLIKCIVSDEDTYIRSQKGTIEEKAKVKLHRKYYKFIKQLSQNKIYVNIVTFSAITMKIHTRIIQKLKEIIK